MGVVSRIEEDSRNKEARQDKEEVDAGPAVLPDTVQKLKYKSAMRSAAIVVKEDHGYCEGPNAIQCGEACFEVNWLEIPDLCGHCAPGDLSVRCFSVRDGRDDERPLRRG